MDMNKDKKDKFEKFLFYFFIFLIPFQTRKILFSSSLTDNFFEWGSGFLYLSDIILVGVFILWIMRLLNKKSDFLKKSDLWLIGLFLIIGLSLITSVNLELSIYQFIKLTELILLFLYIRTSLEFLELNKILKVFVISGICQAVLAIVQFFNQASLGLKYIEAGIFNVNIPGTATFFVNGVKLIRAYGTAPHPNVLAVFLLVSIFCVYVLWLKNTKRSIINYGLLVTAYGLLFLGLFLTFSRAVIIVFIFGSALFFLISFLKLKELKPKIFILFLLFVACCLLFTVIFWPEFQARFLNISSGDQAISLRVYYNDIAVSVIKERPILGLGVGNFTWYLFNNYRFQEFWLYQPVHNLYLLIVSEIGILGLVLFLVFIARILLKGLKQIRKIYVLCFMVCVLCFMILGLIDHYFWTIQQSRLLFWIILAIVSGFFLKKSPSSLLTE